VALPAGAREIDPDAEMAKESIKRNLAIMDEFHRVVTDDGHRWYARIQVMASEAHPLPLELLEQLIEGLRQGVDGRTGACRCLTRGGR
jgi:hypothetical protein